MAFLLHIRQAGFNLRPIHDAKRHRAEGREDVPFELEAVNAHAALLQRQRRVGIPFRPHEFRERHGYFWLAPLLSDRAHSRLEDFECFVSFHLTDETDCFRTLNAVNRSVRSRHVFPPAEYVALSLFAANYQTTVLVTRSSHRTPFGSSSAVSCVAS